MKLNIFSRGLGQGRTTSFQFLAKESGLGEIYFAPITADTACADERALFEKLYSELGGDLPATTSSFFKRMSQKWNARVLEVAARKKACELGLPQLRASKTSRASSSPTGLRSAFVLPRAKSRARTVPRLVVFNARIYYM